MVAVAGRVRLPANAATWITASGPFTATDALGMLRFVVVVSMVALSASAAGPITGRASVVDGDTIELAGQKVRFNGIDAPENWQLCKDAGGRDYRCGQAAANALDTFLSASRPVMCEFVTRDRYRRFVGNCFRADGASVQSWLVRNGHALDWPRYSKGAYAADQALAEKAKAGMWQGDFIPPWEARAVRRGGS